MKQNNQLSFIPETQEERKRKYGFRSSDFAEGGVRERKIPTTPQQAIVIYFLKTIYSYRGIDFHIPQRSLAKYYTRLKSIIEDLGSVENTEKYVDWFITSDGFIKNAFNFDLMIAQSVVERFKVSDRGKKILASPRGYMSDLEEVKNNKGGIIL